MIYIGKEHAAFSHSAAHKPAAAIVSGETVVFETYDCFYNQLTDDTASLDTMDAALSNPATGPLYVEGACPGDMLQIEILRIQTGKKGICMAFPVAAFLNRFEESFRRYTVEDGSIRLHGQVSIPAAPMIGVIGTAPAQDACSTGTAGCHGGNMDCTRIREGATLYLPVFVPGGLLSLGDLHAVMGDGEVCGCGLEIDGNVTVRVSIIKEPCFRWPFVTDASHIHILASAESLEAACHSAVTQAQELLEKFSGMAPAEIAMFLSLCGNLVICQNVNPAKTVRMELLRSQLPFSFTVTPS